MSGLQKPRGKSKLTIKRLTFLNEKKKEIKSITQEQFAARLWEKYKDDVATLWNVAEKEAAISKIKNFIKNHLN